MSAEVTIMMPFKMVAALFLLLSLATPVVSTFVGITSAQRAAPFLPRQQTPPTHQQNMIPVDSIMGAASSNILISTIDSDIANIPTNEFAPVFMGGIVVMFGGVLSALVVGFILENGNLYANVVADSYAQGGDDEEFWEKLSDEEKKKARAMIDQLNAKKDQQDGDGAEAPRVMESSSTKVETEIIIQDRQETMVAENSSSEQELDMFSDYADAGKK